MLANKSKVNSQGIGEVSLSPSLDLNFLFFFCLCLSFSLIYLSQLTKSLNCSVTFDVNSFVIQECGTGQMIGEGHEYRGLCYLGTSSLYLVLHPHPLNCYMNAWSSSFVKIKRDGS